MRNRIRTGCFMVPFRPRPAFRCFLFADNGITCRDCANDSVKFVELNGLTRTINKLFHRNQALKIGKNMYVTEPSSCCELSWKRAELQSGEPYAHSVNWLFPSQAGSKVNGSGIRCPRKLIHPILELRQQIFARLRR